MTTDTSAPPAWTCGSCGATRTKPEKRLPGGWKKRAEEIYCDACWKKNYLLRAITVPVVSPLDQTWAELRAVLREMWGATTQASNWMLTELYARDVRRTSEPKLPPMPAVYLYPEARERFPSLPSQSIATLEQQVKAKYRAKRYEVVWTCAASLPTYRYPTPFPCPNQGWSLSFEELVDKEKTIKQVPIVSVRLGDQRVRLRLKGGPRYRRQRASLEKIASGSAVQGQLDLYQRGDDLLCKLVAWLPRDPDERGKERTGTLYVRTAPDAMLIGLDSKAEKLWTYHGDQVPRWSAEHREQLQHWADDSKAEHRPDVPFQARREEAAVRYRNRMASACHQMAAMVAGYARRRRFAAVEYRDADTSFCPDFTWFRLRELLREKCDAVDVAFEHASGEEKTESAEPPAED